MQFLQSLEESVFLSFLVIFALGDLLSGFVVVTSLIHYTLEEKYPPGIYLLTDFIGHIVFLKKFALLAITDE